MRVSGKLTILLLLSLMMLATPAGAERLRITPVPPHFTPQWTPVPEAPQVSYAPNIPTDVFRYKGKYYFYWAGIWYHSKKVKGPYDRLKKLPEVFSQVDARYYKTVPKEVQEQAPSPPPEPAPQEGPASPETPPPVEAPGSPTSPEGAPPVTPENEPGK